MSTYTALREFEKRALDVAPAELRALAERVAAEYAVTLKQFEIVKRSNLRGTAEIELCRFEFGDATGSVSTCFQIVKKVGA